MDDYLSGIRADAAAFAHVVRAHPLDTPVPSCPGWDLRALAGHLGGVHRWARLAAVTGAQPDEALIDPPSHDAPALAAWLEQGADALARDLSGIPDDAPTWHPFPVARVAAVWPRRQAHETAIHRWDAEAAVGTPTPIDPDRATDFVGEYLTVVVPRVVDRDARLAPQGTIRIVLTDTDAEFGVRVDGRDVHLVDAATVSTSCVIGGSASDVLLALWRRAPLAGEPTDPLVAEWLAFGGN